MKEKKKTTWLHDRWRENWKLSEVRATQGVVPIPWNCKAYQKWCSRHQRLSTFQKLVLKVRKCNVMISGELRRKGMPALDKVKKRRRDKRSIVTFLQLSRQSSCFVGFLVPTVELVNPLERVHDDYPRTYDGSNYSIPFPRIWLRQIQSRESGKTKFLVFPPSKTKYIIRTCKHLWQLENCAQNWRIWEKLNRPMCQPHFEWGLEATAVSGKMQSCKLDSWFTIVEDLRKLSF